LPSTPLARLLAAAAVALAAAAGHAQEATPLPRPEPAAAPAPVDPAAEARLFAMPKITEAVRGAIELAQAGELEAGTRRIDGLLERYPGVPLLHLTRAALAMPANDPETAIENLEAAAAEGAPGLAAVLTDPLFAPVAADPRTAAVAATPPAPAPAPPPAAAVAGKVLVSGANTVWNPDAERLEPRFELPEQSDAEVVPRRNVAAYDLLRDHVREGRAAGNIGDLYDNRDRGHSALDPAEHPQVTRVAYAAAARAAEVDYGLNDVLLFDHVTFGNSSTAFTGGALWRSLPRAALTRADGSGPLRLWQNASANHLYVYPAHKDYGKEQGDLFPANTPYLIVSHGSSGSDKPFLDAVAMILAAFRPDTKARLAEENLVVPTVQMVFRRSQQHVTSRADYMSGKGNPAVFEAYDINLARMVSLANSIRADEVPPQVRIRVLSEDLGREGVDYFGEGLAEQLFDTPAAVARVWRSSAGRRSITLTAEETRDPNDRPLTFEWRLLQGDPEKVTIEPSEDGRQARITLDWHDPFRIAEDNPLISSRIDVGVFANNGKHDSAPAILSVYCPPDQARIYAAGPDGAPRVVSIDYAARPGSYVDPMLIARAGWRDDYHYDADGALTGWTRTRADGPTPEEFTAEGYRRLSPGRAEVPAYPLERDDKGGLRVEEVASGRVIDIPAHGG
jgi:hypothetical protein